MRGMCEAAWLVVVTWAWTTACATQQPKPEAAPPDVAPEPTPSEPVAPEPAPEPPMEPAPGAAIVVTVEADARPIRLQDSEAVPYPTPLDVEKLPKAKVTGKVLAKLCKKPREDGGVDEGKCGIYALPAAAGAILHSAVTYWHNADNIPAPTQIMRLALETKAGWKDVGELGTGEVGAMGLRTDDEVYVLGSGAHDFGGELGGWVWLDVGQRRSNIPDGRFWERRLWLCGGADPACKVVEVMRYDAERDEDGEPTGVLSAERAVVVTVHEDGQVSVFDKLERRRTTHRIDRLP